MQNTTLLVIIGLVVILGAAIILAQNRPVGTAVTTNEGTRVEAPGTRVESDRDSTRIQAPGVDITVPRDKDRD